MKKRIFSALLAIMLIITMLPANLVFAEDEPATIKDVIEASEDGLRPEGTPENYVKVTVNLNREGEPANQKIYYVNPDVEVLIPVLEEYKRDNYYNLFPNDFTDNMGYFPAFFDRKLKDTFKQDTEINMLYGHSKLIKARTGDIIKHMEIVNSIELPDNAIINREEFYDSEDEQLFSGTMYLVPVQENNFPPDETGDYKEYIKYIKDENDNNAITVIDIPDSYYLDSVESITTKVKDGVFYTTFCSSRVSQPENKNFDLEIYFNVGFAITDKDVMPEKEDGSKPINVPDYYKLVEFKVDDDFSFISKKNNEGKDLGSRFWVNPKVEIDLSDFAPDVKTDKSHSFEGWDKPLKGTFTENTVINAKISEIPFDKENIVKMKIASEPSKMSYIDGDELDLTGLKIKLTDKNDVEKIIELKDLAEYGIITEPIDKAKLTAKDNDKTIIVKKEGLDKVETKGKLSVTNAVFIPNKPALTEVENLDKITEEEKAKVKEKIIKANPDIKTEEITVNDNGSVIIKHDGKIGTLKPEETIVKKSEDKKDNEKYPVNKPEKKTEVINKEKLTPEEKAKVKEEVKKTNPKAKDIEVKDNGDVVITYPDGSINELKQEDTVIQKKSEDTKKDNEKYPVVKPEKVGVKDIDDLTYREKLKVEEAIKKANPHVKYINVKDNGDSTITYPDGSTNELKQKDTVYKYKESREPFVDRVYEGDEYITGKGEPYSYIEITLENKRMLSGKTDRNGDFKIKCPYELRKDDVIEVVQYEDLYDASKPVVVRVEGPRDPKDKLIKDEHSAYIVGYPNGQFGPNNTITRAEAAAMLARLSKNQTVRRTMNFSDVKYGDWFYNAVNIGVSEGFIKGYFDGTFRPNEPITRAEFAVAISTYADNAKSEHKFKDVKGWSAGYIDTAYANGWMKGYDRNTFRPNNCLTRAEAVATINRMLNRRPDKKFIDKELLTYTTRNKFFSDVNGRDWFFYDIYEATWGHDYEAKKDVETWTKVTGKTFILR